MVRMLVLLLLVACDRSEPDAQDLICGNTSSYWDANVGYGYAFARDGTCYEYTYNDQGKRERADYGDVRIDYFNWHVAGNQLSIELPNWPRTFEIVRLTGTEMVLRPSNKNSVEVLPVERVVLTKVSE
ncbi:hypothetical protein ABIB44_003807 [Hymenobacter sp. UYCo722]